MTVPPSPHVPPTTLDAPPEPPTAPDGIIPTPLQIGILMARLDDHEKRIAELESKLNTKDA